MVEPDIRLHVGERRRVAISLERRLSENDRITSVIGAGDYNNCVTVSQLAVITSRISVGGKTLHPGRGVLATIDGEREGLAHVWISCQTADGQVVKFSRKIRVEK